MTELEARWAASRVEAMADGSLSPDEERRMRAAIARDPALALAVRRAAQLRVELAKLGRAAVPRSLRRRLWSIAGGALARRPAVPAWALRGAVAGVAAAAAAIAWVHVQNAREREAAAALAQVEIAMTYLKRSSAIAGQHVTQAMRTSLLAAAEASRRVVEEEPAAAPDGDGA